MMKKYLYLPLSLLLLFSCNHERENAQDQFRERQQAILERNGQGSENATTDDTIVVVEDEKKTVSEASKTPEATTGDKVVGVKDGDTIVLLRNGEQVTVRLYGVDTPEKNQAYGQRAKQFTSDLTYGKTVQLIINNTDRYGRTVGTIILPDGRSLNEELVRNGYAWHYKAYSKDQNLANAEVDARRFKRGLWQDPNPIAPWDFRKEQRSGNSPSTANAPIPAGATKRTVYLCNSGNSAVYHYDSSCYVLKRCKDEIVKTTEADAIRQYGRRADKTCSR